MALSTEIREELEATIRVISLFEERLFAFQQNLDFFDATFPDESRPERHTQRQFYIGGLTRLAHEAMLPPKPWSPLDRPYQAGK